jgi:hypothetical protein
MKKFGLVLVLSVAAAGLALAAPADNFKAGGLEFGGNFMYSYNPEYPVFSSNTTAQQRGGSYQDIDAALDIGFFPVKNLSIGLMPSMFYFRYDYLNGSLSSYMYQSLQISLDAGVSYYVPMGSKLFLSLVGKLGLGINPGLNYVNAGTTITDKSLALVYSFEPDIGLYYFLSDHLAPFIQAGCKFMDYRTITNNDGSSYQYPSSYQFFDGVWIRASVTIGLKYFLPVGGRFNEAQRNVDDVISQMWD